MKKFLTAVGMIAIIASLVPSFVFADNSGSTLPIAATSQASNKRIVLYVDKTSGFYPLTVNFTAVFYNLPNCGESWNFGDGSVVASGCSSGTDHPPFAARIVPMTHTYTAAGSYVVTISANGATSNTITIVASKYIPPLAGIPQILR